MVYMFMALGLHQCTIFLSPVSMVKPTMVMGFQFSARHPWTEVFLDHAKGFRMQRVDRVLVEKTLNRW